MNNEPVAWMGKDYDGIKTDFYFDVEKNKLPYRTYETAIPLYTHPAKTLTDEEIQELALCDEFWISEDCTIFDWHKFARAILRKAQEK
jgi:hypothetical protein